MKNIFLSDVNATLEAVCEGIDRTMSVGGIVKLLPGIESGGTLSSVTRPCSSRSRTSARTRRRVSDGIWRRSSCDGEGGTGWWFHRGRRGPFAPALPI